MNMDTNKYYEIGFVITPSIEEENAKIVSKEISSFITKLGGNIIDGEEPRLRRLAYPMYKVISGQKIAATSGFFGWTKFEIDSEKSSEAVQTIEKELKTIQELLRFILVKTVKEKTYIPKEPEAVEEEVPQEGVIEEEIAEDGPEQASDDSREEEVVEEEKEE